MLLLTPQGPLLAPQVPLLAPQMLLLARSQSVRFATTGTVTPKMRRSRYILILKDPLNRGRVVCECLTQSLLFTCGSEWQLGSAAAQGAGRRWLITEGVFASSGRIAPLAALR